MDEPKDCCCCEFGGLPITLEKVVDVEVVGVLTVGEAVGRLVGLPRIELLYELPLLVLLCTEMGGGVVAEEFIELLRLLLASFIAKIFAGLKNRELLSL